MESSGARRSVISVVDRLQPGTRVIWVASSMLGTVQPDKSILWDDGSRLPRAEMEEVHGLLLHSEKEWKSLRTSLASMLECLRCGCTVQRWDPSECKTHRPQEVCPVGVLSQEEHGPRHIRRSVRFMRPPAPAVRSNGRKRPGARKSAALL